jgi:hypothetical protein
MKPGLSRKFHRAWSGPHKVTAKGTDLNYEIVDQKGRKQVIHSNRLKPYNGDDWKPRIKRTSEKNPREKPARETPAAEDELQVSTYPLLKKIGRASCRERVFQPV